MIQVGVNFLLLINKGGLNEGKMDTRARDMTTRQQISNATVGKR
jgi:hypothetical protein